ncbi:MAG: beta-1,4-galactosyltransferase enhancer [bacterium]|nr:beta-1,4-galactosyltransferase enhancer [bacterium]
MAHREKRRRLCLVSSSGGHYEQLRMLEPLCERYDLCFVTERTGYSGSADYLLRQTGTNDPLVPLRMLWNGLIAIRIFIKERPAAVITTGSLVALPFLLLAKLCRRPFIYIETFARVTDGSRAGRFMYRYADLFIYQWETLAGVYPNGVFGGSIY